MNDPNPANWKFSQFRINQGHRDFTDDMLWQARASNPDDLMRTARPSSNHSGGVNVVFCDGHADFLDENIEPYLYARRLSTSRFQARHPLVGAGKDPVGVQVIEQLPDGTRLPPY